MEWKHGIGANNGLNNSAVQISSETSSSDLVKVFDGMFLSTSNVIIWRHSFIAALLSSLAILALLSVTYKVEIQTFEAVILFFLLMFVIYGFFAGVVSRNWGKYTSSAYNLELIRGKLSQAGMQGGMRYL